MEPEIKHIAFLVIPEATLLDISGPYEVFSQALELLLKDNGKKGLIYRLHNFSINKRKNVHTASGLIIQCRESIRTIEYPIDTLFIPGVPNSQIEHYKLPKDVLKWIKEQSGMVRRICSVCTGSFFLAEAGVLDGKRVTTHWEKCNILSNNYPDLKVDPDPIFIKEDNIYTSAGITSGMDLALALIEEDLGKPFAIEVAGQMVLYLKRPGTQSQFSTVLTHQSMDYQPVQDVCDWILEHISETMTVDSLAEKISMSSRNFARVFVRETGITPAKYIDKLRIEKACRYLVETRFSLKEIAVLCGLGSTDNMRKVFMKYLNTSPGEYRRNFGVVL